MRFDLTATPNTYNLAFGDEDPVSGKVDYTTVTDNGDTHKVLATIAAIVLVFLRSKPGGAVFAEGSTASRDWLYRVNLSRHLDQLPVHLEALGRLGTAWEPFAPNKKYDALTRSCFAGNDWPTFKHGNQTQTPFSPHPVAEGLHARPEHEPKP